MQHKNPHSPPLPCPPPYRKPDMTTGGRTFILARRPPEGIAMTILVIILAAAAFAETLVHHYPA